MGTNYNKQIGKFCTILPIVMLVAYILLINVYASLNSNKVLFTVLSTAIFITAIGSLLTGEIMVKGGSGPYTKTENPKVYWVVVAVQFTFGLFLLSFALK